MFSEWTLYTLADWWNPTQWTWRPRFEGPPTDRMCTFLFFAIRRKEVTWW